MTDSLNDVDIFAPPQEKPENLNDDAIFGEVIPHKPRGFFESIKNPGEANKEGELLPIAEKVLGFAGEVNANPNIPQWVKSTVNVGAATAATTEEIGEAVAGLGLNGAVNIAELFGQNDTFLHEIQKGRQIVRGELSQAQQERQRNFESTLRTGASALATAGIGAGAKKTVGFWQNVWQSAKLGTLGGSIAVPIDNLLSEDTSNLELILSPFTGAAFGFVGGSLFGLGAETTKAIAAYLPGAPGQVRNLTHWVADRFRKHPTAKVLYNELREADVRPDAANIQPGLSAGKRKLLEAKALSDTELDTLNQLDNANAQAIANKFKQTVVKTVNDLSEAGPENFTSKTAQIVEIDKYAKQIRTAANREFNDMWDKIDSGMQLSRRAINTINQKKATDAAVLQLQDEFNNMAGAKLSANNPLKPYAQAAYNKVGSHYQTTTLDTVVKSLAEKASNASVEGRHATSALFTKASKLAEDLLEDSVPGYAAARRSIGKLDMFPAIAGNADLKKFLTELTGEQVHKLLLNPNTSLGQHRTLLNLLANGIQNTRGETVLPGNKALLASVVKDRMEQSFGKIADLNKSVSKVFAQAFAKNPALRNMWDDTFKILSGKSSQQWQKFMRVVDATFDRYGERLMQDGFNANLEQLLAGDRLNVAAKLLGYFKRRATFNFMFKKDWQPLLEKVARQQTFSNQVDALVGGFMGRGGNALLDNLFNQDEKIQELANSQNSQGNNVDNTKQTMRKRGF